MKRDLMRFQLWILSLSLLFQHKLHQRKTQRAVVFAGVVAIALLFFYSFEPQITGLVTVEQTLVHEVNLSVGGDSNYTFSFDQKVRLQSLVVSGRVIGNGSAQILLGDLVVFETAESDGLIGITGLVVDDSDAVQTNETLNVTTIMINDSGEDTNVNVDVNMSANFSSNATNESNDTVTVSLSYIPNNFDQDNDGVADIDDAIDVLVQANVSFPYDEGNLCTLFEVYSEDTGDSTFVCQGNTACCNFAGLIPATDDWQIYYSYYGKDGATNNNIVQAQVIYYNVSVEDLQAQIVTSEPEQIVTRFFDIVEFDNACRDTCAINLNGTSFTLNFNVESVTLIIDQIVYTYDLELNDSFALPVSNVQVINTSLQALLKWDAPVDSDGVYVFRSNSNVSLNYSEAVAPNVTGITDVANVTNVTNYVSGSALVDTSVDPGQYYYTIFSYNKAGVVSAGVQVRVTVVGENGQPILLAQIPDVVIAQNEIAHLNVGLYFLDPDNDTLAFSARQPNNITIDVVGSTAIIQPGFDFVGRRTTFVTAFDGSISALSNLFSINVTGVVPSNVSVPVGVVEINKPVVWRQRASAKDGSVTVSIPEDTINATVRLDGSELDKQTVTVVHHGTIRDLETFEAEQEIVSIDKKLGTLPVVIGISSERNTLQTRKFELEDLLQDKIITPVEGNVSEIVVENVSLVDVEFTTRGPEAIEEELGNKKRITVSGNFAYRNVFTYTTIEERPKDSIKLYWFATPGDYAAYLNGTVNDTVRVEITNNNQFNVTFVDVNNNTLIDRVEWITPHLSNQSFEIELTVLNVQSYPTLFGNWTVAFNASGSANLTISASNGTRFTDVFDDNASTGDDLETLSLTCGNQTLYNKHRDIMSEGVYFVLHNGSFVKLNETYNESHNESFLLQSLFVENYTCNQLSEHTVRVITGGKHTQEYQFDGLTAYAFNLVQGEFGGLSGGRGGGFELITGAFGFIGSVGNGSGHNTTIHANVVTGNTTDSGLLEALLGYIHIFTGARGTNLTISENLNATLVDRNASVRVSGLVQLSNGTNVSGVDVTIDHTNITNVVTNASGEYSHTFFAPNSDGTYSISVNTSYLGELAANSISLLVDSSPPTWSGNKTNTTTYLTNKTIQFNVTWQDGGGLSYYVFSWNDTGTWVNVSNVSISGQLWVAVENHTITAANGATVAWKYYANDTLGKWNETDEFSFEVKNTAPEVSNVLINSTDHLNRTNGTLIGEFTFSDDDSNPIAGNETRWYNESAEISSLANATFVGPANFTKGQNWTFSVRVFDGTNYSNWVNSSVFVVQNTIPSVPVLDSPEDLANLTDPTPEFIWNAALDNDFNDGKDNLTYEILIDCPTCALVNGTNLSATNFTPTADLDLDVAYNWTVRAFDGEVYSDWSASRNFTVFSFSIIVVNGTVNFTGLTLGQVDDTTDENPYPFIIENDGNVNVNVSVYAQQSLWIRAPLNTSNFQFKVDNTSEGLSFNSQTSALNFTNVTGIGAGSAVLGVGDLSPSDSADTVEVDIRVSVPLDEPAGTRSSILVFEAIGS